MHKHQPLTPEEKQEFLADKSPVWAYDFYNYRMLWANDAALEFWKAESHDEFVSRDYSTDSRAIRERLWQCIMVIRPGEWSRESWTVFPGGEATTALIDARLISVDDNDSVILFRLVRKLDTAFADPEGLRMMLAARTTPVAVTMFDMQGRMLSENPAALSLRYAHRGWTQQATQLQLRYGSRQRAEEIIAATRQDERLEFEHRLAGNGNEQVLAVTTRRVRDPVTGDVVAQLTEEDITRQANLAASLAQLNEELESRVERRSRELKVLNEQLMEQIVRRRDAQKAVEHERDFMRTLMEAIPVPLLYQDQNGKYLGCNEPWAEFLGVPKDQVIGREVLDVIQTHADDEPMRTDRIVMETGKPGQYPMQIKRLDGELRHVVAHKAPFVTLDGQRGLICALIDITDTVAMEEKLRKSQKMEAIGHLTGGIAHDFNNLLAVVQGNAELLEVEPTSHADFVAEIKAATRRGAELTRNLLAYARQQPLNARPVDLREQIPRMENILKRTLGAHIELSVSFNPDLWTAIADAGQVDDAILNLTLNARDAMPQGGSLSIALDNATIERLDEPDADEVDDVHGQFVVITVTDSGSGMTREVLSRAMDPFFTTKPVGKGSGLGLSMVYGFARQSEGTMTIYSEPGRGTSVKLYLPRDNSKVALARDRRAEPELPQGSGECVLVVEDDGAVRRLVERMLASIGYDPVSFENAREALEHLRSGSRVDLLLSDVILPGKLDGPALARIVRRDFPAVRILLMSGYPAEAARETGSAGIDAVLLNKPINRSHFAAAISTALGGPS